MPLYGMMDDRDPLIIAEASPSLKIATIAGTPVTSQLPCK